jgi:hypothetical protein
VNDTLPKIPYGYVKSIVCGMDEGDTRVIRPAYASSFLTAARDGRFALSCKRIIRGGIPLIQIKKVGLYCPLRYVPSRTAPIPV